MTRGSAFLILKDKVLESVEFNGNMYPEGYGDDFLEGLKECQNEKDFKQFIYNFNQENFQYKEKLVYEIKTVVTDKSNNKARVSVDIYAPNFIELMAQSMDEAFKSTPNKKDTEKLDKTIFNIMMKNIDEENIPKVKSSIIVDLDYKNNRWVLQPNEDFFTAIKGGLEYIPKIFEE